MAAQPAAQVALRDELCVLAGWTPAAEPTAEVH